MNVLVLGIDHEIQKVDAGRPDETKNNYRGLLTRLIEEHRVEFIGEEAHPDLETVGKQLSDALRLPFQWTNINMPEAVRKAQGLYEEHIRRAGITLFPITKSDLIVEMEGGPAWASTARRWVR